MAVRRPLVIVGQEHAELPAADALPSTELDPSTFGSLAWSDDPALVTSTNKPASGVITLSLAVAAASRVSGATLTFTLEVTTAGATLTAGQSLIGLYRSDGTTLTRLALSADQSTAWTTVGVKTATAVTSAAINPGDVLYLVALSVGTTTPTFRAALAATLVNAGPVKRRATVSAQTALPATIAVTALIASTLNVGMVI